MISLSHDIYYSTVAAVDNLKFNTLEVELKNVIHYHAVRDFHVVLIILDVQFKSLRYRNRVGVKLNVISRGEHTLVIE